MSSSRLLALGDVHGCLAALDALLTAIDLRDGDQLVGLGDYVDRGPDSRRVVERLIALQNAGQFLGLRGNHEIMMANARDSLQDEKFWRKFGGDETLASYAIDGEPGHLDDVPPRHWQFFVTDCQPWFETDDTIFVHAGVEPSWELSMQLDEWLYWRPIANRGPHCSGKRVICGHSEQRSGEPLDLRHTVCIDTHAYGAGWLTALDVVTDEYWQANETGMVRQGRLTGAKR